ncbi:MAG: hypothetical protein J5544_00170 [Clostridia bacterium]|nr:hypothetical protein [Clostridia bacterium]
MAKPNHDGASRQIVPQVKSKAWAFGEILRVKSPCGGGIRKRIKEALPAGKAPFL